MNLPQDPILRRKFLGTLLASASVGAAALPFPLQLGVAKEPTAPAPNDSEFDQWLNKINGKHRQLFDAPDANSGFPLAWLRVFLMTNKAAGVEEKDVTVVVVLRHEAIALGLESRVWKKYGFDKMFKISAMGSKTVLTENGFWKPKERALPLPGMSIDQLQESGVMFGICDMALTVMSSMAGKKMKMDGAEVKKDWVSGILSGIQLVPSGVLAINRAQEHGCAYCYAG